MPKRSPARRLEDLPADSLQPSINAMSTLSELEKAAEALSAEEKQRLIVFLAARLRAESPQMPPPRTFSREQIDAWVKEDEEELRALKQEG